MIHVIVIVIVSLHVIVIGKVYIVHWEPHCFFLWQVSIALNLQSSSVIHYNNAQHNTLKWQNICHKIEPAAQKLYNSFFFLSKRTVYY